MLSFILFSFEINTQNKRHEITNSQFILCSNQCLGVCECSVLHQRTIDMHHQDFMFGSINFLIWHCE